MKKTLLMAGVSAFLLAASALQSHAVLDISGPITFGTWAAATDGVSADGGNSVWKLNSVSASALASGAFMNLTVDFYSLAKMRVQDADGMLLGPGEYSFNYDIELNNGMKFTTVAVDSNVPQKAGTTVTKVVSWDNASSPVTVSSINGSSSGPVALSGLPSSINIAETVHLDDGATMLSFGNTFGVVPEPSTVIAGALLLLPFGAGIIRSVRKNRKQ